MTDRPILFSAPMVRALLEGRKTQTRRLLKAPTSTQLRGIYAPGLSAVFGDPDHPTDEDLSIRLFSLKDRLWVREHWKTDRGYDDLPPRDMGGEEPLIYLADKSVQRWGWEPDAMSIWGRHRQAMHMPRWASRLTLTVTNVRVQRLQDINEDDARCEGCQENLNRLSVMNRFGGVSDTVKDLTVLWEFRDLWDSLHADRAPWDSNPWVVAYSFEVAHASIDEATS